MDDKTMNEDTPQHVSRRNFIKGVIAAGAAVSAARLAETDYPKEIAAGMFTGWTDSFFKKQLLKKPAAREVIADALRRHAPDIPVVAVTRTDTRAMAEVVAAAAALGAEGLAAVLPYLQPAVVDRGTTRAVAEEEWSLEQLRTEGNTVVQAEKLEAPIFTPSTISPTPPSCEFANTCSSTRPLVRSLMSLATSSAHSV